MRTLTITEIEQAIHTFKLNQLPIFIKQEKYYKGQNPTILNRPDQNPNNKISVPFVKKAINTITGYMAKVGNIVISDEANEEYLTELNKENSADITTNAEFVNAIVNGKSFEIHYIDPETVRPKFLSIPASQIIPFYDTTPEKKIEAFIYIYNSQAPIYENSFDVFSYADVYYSDRVERYISNGIDKYVPNKDEKGNYIFETYYNQAPIVEFNINKDKSNVFDHVTNLIDQHDVVVSDNIANELARTALSYLVTTLNIDDVETDENGETRADRIAKTRFFDNLDEKDFVKFLEKNIPEGFVNMTADRFERLIYEMLQIPNFNDETFGGAESGVAIQYKLIDFENLCSSIEAYFSKGLKARYNLINNISKRTATPKQLDVNIKFNRNLPFDIKNLTEIVERLIPILSTETILKMFPKYIIPDIQKELKAIEEQKKMDLERLSALETEPKENEEDEEENE